MSNRLLSVAALIAVSTAAGLVTPASAIEIRKEPQLYTVTPAMMSAIHTIVREEMRMRHRHMRHG